MTDPSPALNSRAARADTRSVITQTWLLAPWAMLWIVLVRGLLVRAGILPPTCNRCGLQFERRKLGGGVCRCAPKGQSAWWTWFASPRWKGRRARG